MIKKTNLISLVLTLIIVSTLILAKPASAIDISLTTPSINLGVDSTKEFLMEVNVNDGEFLPILYTDIVFDDGTSKITCNIDSNNVVSGCSFLTVGSVTVSNLNSGNDFGYGYGYNSITLDYKYDFGDGFGYGASGQTGTIVYKLVIDASELPDSFTGKTIGVEAKVYGGNAVDNNYFKGTSSFDVNSATSDTGRSGGGGGYVITPEPEIVEEPVVSLLEPIPRAEEETLVEEPTTSDVGVGLATDLFNRAKENWKVLALIVAILAILGMGSVAHVKGKKEGKSSIVKRGLRKIFKRK